VNIDNNNNNTNAMDNNNANNNNPPHLPNYAHMPIFLSTWNQRGTFRYSDWDEPTNHKQQYELHCNLWFFLIVYGSMWKSFKRAVARIPVVGLHDNVLYNQVPPHFFPGVIVHLEADVQTLINQFIDTYNHEKVLLMARLSETLQTFLIQHLPPHVALQNLPTDRQGNGIQPPNLREELDQHMHCALHTILLYLQEIEESFVAHRDRYFGEFTAIVHNGTRYIECDDMFNTIYQDSIAAEWEPDDIMEQLMDDLSRYP
jgi:hypothetical protein